MDRHLHLAALALLALVGCAHAHHELDGEKRSTWAFGQNAVAAIYGPLPVRAPIPPGGEVVKDSTQTIDRTWPARDEVRHTVTRTPVELAAEPLPIAPLLQRSEGAPVTEVVGGMFRSLLGVLWSGAKWVFGVP